MPDASQGQDAAGKKEQEAQEAQTNRDKAMVRWTRAVAIFTGLLVISNCVSDWYIGSQLSDARAAQRLTQEQLRASFSVTGFGQGESVNPEGKPTQGFIFQFENIGGTRTAWAHAWVSAHYFPDKIPNNFDTSRAYDETPAPTDTVVGPNGKMPYAVGVPLNDAKQAASGQGEIVIWGRGEYATIYEPKTPIGIGFCYLMLPLKLPAVQDSKADQPRSGGDAIQPQQNAHIPTGNAGLFFSPQIYRPECNYSR
jgi:hypothetical protein